MSIPRRDALSRDSVPRRARARPYLAALYACAALAALHACAGDTPSPIPLPGPGVTFTYPADDQWDVPTGARLVLAFTDPVDPEAVAAGCGVAQDGPLCIVGPRGAVPDQAFIVGERGTAIQIQAELEPGATYQVFARPQLLQAQAENLPQDQPLFTFHTRSLALLSATAPQVLTVNGDAPGAFEPDSGLEPRYPTMDFMTVRVLFSEPMDPATLNLDASVRMTRVDAAGELDVPATLLAQGVHLTVDPDDDLEPGARYRLYLDDTIRDLGGDALEPRTFEFTPLSSRSDSVLIEQVLDADPAAGDADFPGQDSIAGSVPNAIDMAHPLVGANTIYLQDGSVASNMADPAAFGGPIPITIRKGQTLRATGLDIALGGAIPAGLSTGDIRVSFVSDASGVIVRNPYRDPELPPNDAGAPIFLSLTFDVAVTADDALGNAVLNQTILNVQATGVSVVEDGALAIETVGTMELGLLGVASAPSHMVMRLETNTAASVVPDTQGPRLVASNPTQLDDRVNPAVRLLLTFDEPIWHRGPGAPATLVRTSDQSPVAATIVATGSTLVIAPEVALDPGQTYTATFAGAIADLAGNPLELEPGDPTSGTGTLVFQVETPDATRPAAPIMTALYPGVGCALEGALDQSPGRCAGGAQSDVLYRPFTLSGTRPVEGYFNQPVDPTSVILGPICATGSVRVEAYDASGACIAPVPGTLVVAERSFRFVPDAPWQPGARYRVSVIAGPDATCQVGEVCGQNLKALNSDPIRGMVGSADPGQDAGGGPDIVIPFTGAAPDPSATYLAGAIARPADMNGNGYLDPGEAPRLENSAGSEITGFGGIVDNAALDGPDCAPDIPGTQVCIYVAGTLPVDIGTVETDCTIDGQTVPVCVPSVVHPQVMLGTSVAMDATATMGNPPFTITMDNLPTGQLLMRVRDGADGPILGYLVPGAEGPRFSAVLDLYMDAPDMPLGNFNLDHDLRSKQLSIAVEGPVGFTDDGRIRIDAVNTRDIVLDVNLVHNSLPNTQGFVTMTIPAGAMQLSLTSRPPHASLVREALR